MNVLRKYKRELKAKEMEKELYPGARVAFKDEAGEARVSKILANGKVLVLDEDDFEMEYDVQDLILVDDAIDAIYEKSVSKGKLDKDRPGRRKNPVKHRRDEVEVDLHIEELVDDHRGWTNAEIIEYQLDKFESVLSAAFQTRKRKMIVIHGRGDGVLRYEIRKKLQDYPGVEVHDANFKTYGQGATEILLHK